jgi:hypothetical protein
MTCFDCGAALNPKRAKWVPVPIPPSTKHVRMVPVGADCYRLRKGQPTIAARRAVRRGR